MSGRTHTYEIDLTWTGNTGTGTSGYRDYARTHEITGPGKTPLIGSADPAFRGDPALWNPEELLVAALAACHKLWYLHLCATGGVRVVAYRDRATGTMVEDDNGGHFTEVVLAPEVTISADSDADAADRLHAEASRLCFIKNSVNFPVRHRPTLRTEGAD